MTMSFTCYHFRQHYVSAYSRLLCSVASGCSYTMSGGCKFDIQFRVISKQSNFAGFLSVLFHYSRVFAYQKSSFMLSLWTLFIHLLGSLVLQFLMTLFLPRSVKLRAKGWILPQSTAYDVCTEWDLLDVTASSAWTAYTVIYSLGEIANYQHNLYVITFHL